MKIDIKYNDEIDEFTPDLTLEGRLNRYIKEKCPIIYAFPPFTNTYLLGGGIRDLIYAKKPKDLDFVIMDSKNEGYIKEVLKKFNIQYRYNRFGGYKFTYNDIEIDLWATDDLYSSIEYNVDGLLFDVGKGELLSLTFDDFIKNGLIKINPNNNIDNERVEKLKKFEKEFRMKNSNK